MNTTIIKYKSSDSNLKIRHPLPLGLSILFHNTNVPWLKHRIRGHFIYFMQCSVPTRWYERHKLAL